MLRLDGVKLREDELEEHGVSTTMTTRMESSELTQDRLSQERSG